METTRAVVGLSGGRQVDVWTRNLDRAAALLLHGGTPCSGLPSAAVVAAADRARLGYLSYSRPGYGDSTRQPGRSVADCAADVAELAGALGVRRLHVVGWSGGGPHALACARLLPGLVASTATIGGVAPWGAEGLDWLAGMGPENVEELGLAVEGEAALRPWLEREAETLGRVTGPEVAEALGGLVDAVDREALTGAFAEEVAATFREALRTGVWGWLDDDLAFASGWGFELHTIATPVSVWQGALDRMVPFDHGRWLAALVPGATAHLLPDEGHLSLAATEAKLEVIVRELVERGGSR